MLPMILRKVDLSFEKLVQWRWKWADVSISLPQLQIGFIESWTLCLNLCSRRWLKHNLNLVDNLTPLGLWQLKTVLLEGRMKFKSVLLKIFKLSELRIFRFSLFHSITAEGKKEFWKKLFFILNRKILLIYYFRHEYLKIFKKQHSFLYHLLFSRVSKPSSSYSFSLDIPLIAPVANTALCWIGSSYWWNEALYTWSYTMSP